MAINSHHAHKRPAASGREVGKEMPVAYLDRTMEAFHKGSKLHYKNVPHVDSADLVIGETLGNGGFATVKAVELHGRHYAMKQLSDSVVQGDRENFATGAADLIKEAEFLSALDHPNIIKIHGKNTSTVHDDFIIIDRLVETLPQRLRQWRERETRAHGTNQRLRFLHERLRVCLQICDALNYLHLNNVIYRDLKASNVGFDEEGNVKLFGKSRVPFAADLVTDT